MKKTVVFDLDGTLAHTSPTLAIAMNYFLEKKRLPAIDAPLMESFLGNGARVLLKNVYAYLSLPNEESDIDENIDGFFESYEKTYLLAEPYEGIYKILKMLEENDVTIGVLSNKPHRFVPPLVKKLFPDVNIAFAEGQTERPRKPDPTVLLEYLKKFDSSPECCAFVGDSNVDIKTAKRAGASAYAVSWGYCETDKLTRLSPDILANTREELYFALKAFAEK